MLVDSVRIKLHGKFDLNKLATLNYRQQGKYWLFDGAMHRYIFKPVSESSVEIIIKAKPSNKLGLPYSITFSQIQDWVGKSVETIDFCKR